MKIGILGKKSLPIYLKLALMTAVLMLIWLFGILILIYFDLGDYGFWFTLPFFLLGVMSFLGVLGIGPFHKQYVTAIIEDDMEERKKYQVQQPWE
jgi:hypothetical protein